MIPLAIMNWEWIIVIVLIVVIFLWGPQKLPELARSIGLAKKEFEKASKGIEDEIKKSSTTDERIIEIAKNLGIKTEGKTREQIVQEILEKTRAR
ncbi:MAG: twin-arginine translocase TatA/TatE family subunit [Candidatus Methanomethylicia archaeon]